VYAEELRAKILIEEEKSRDRQDLQKHTEMQLCASLLDVACDLERRTRVNFVLETGVEKGIDDWSVGTIAET
jgi:hypothetical protein